MVYTETKNPFSGMPVEIKFKSAKKTYYVYTGTSSKGIINYRASNLPAGTYKAIINYGEEYLPQKTITVKITKAKPSVKAPKVTNKFKKTKYFKVTVKLNKKGEKNVVLKLKINKKIYKIKTNSKGVAKFNTKKLKVGKHKVTITSATTNYNINVKSLIKIKR